MEKVQKPSNDEYNTALPKTPLEPTIKKNIAD
jgi:hypothetical protein